MHDLGIWPRRNTETMPHYKVLVGFSHLTVIAHCRGIVLIFNAKAKSKYILRFIRNARWDIMNIIRRILIENVSFLSDIVLNHYERGRRRQNFHNKAFQLFILQKNKDDAR